ncbi:hypothetical protein DesfrDRAFT_0056 [Solidesulfovibrio fructosivorans JJ]]|uniref:Uncharacterized protein n=1 Tax=Solidesulfovibrio fructosivorans JJ] TaxID=596151 RepID=E1JR07_SOLFR|nr:hypothetical protein [Solidesulfovibrio fructosivorans]EFL53008.1 hypothetical protein DesfrDRAFT_0056 [Solidesulfovibrio fructosivorans JJ]]
MLTDAPGVFLTVFGADATYTASNAGASIQAIVEDCAPWDGINASLRTSYNDGQARLGMAWVRPTDLPVVQVFGHTLEQDGRTWTVSDSWPEGDMLVLGLFRGVFVVDVEVKKDLEVSDGALGYKTVPTTIWTGKAAVHGLSGHERLLSGREIGVGYRNGFLPACPDLVPGCLIATPNETLHVTSSYTDHARGWTVFEAEARQEDQ